MRLVLAIALAALAPRLARAAPEEASTWTVDASGRRFRTTFDPGDRLFAGLAVGTGAGLTGAALEAGLLVRAPPPPPLAPVFWKRDHELGVLRLRPADAWLDGRI